MVDGVVFYRTFNPTVAITKVENADMATQMLAQTTLRNMLGTKNLSEILTDREEMADQMEVKTEFQFLMFKSSEPPESKVQHQSISQGYRGM